MPSMVTKENGGCSSSTHRATRGSRRRLLPLSESAAVLNTRSPMGESGPTVAGSRANQIGASWGRPSARTVASFPVRAGSPVRKATSSSPVIGCWGIRSSARARRRSGRSGGRQSELPVIPRDGALHGELGHDPLVEHGLDERAQLLGVDPVVALEQVDPELPHLVGIVDDLGPADQFDPAQLLVVVAVLEHAGHPRVAPEVDRLLGLGLGLDGDRAFEESVPHGHCVDRAVVIERTHGHRAPFVEEGIDLLAGQPDQVALLDAVAHLLVDLLLFAHPTLPGGAGRHAAPAGSVPATGGARARMGRWTLTPAASDGHRRAEQGSLACTSRSSAPATSAGRRWPTWCSGTWPRIRRFRAGGTSPIA